MRDDVFGEAAKALLGIGYPAAAPPKPRPVDAVRQAIRQAGAGLPVAWLRALVGRSGAV